ncbi:MAG: hypothetical protein E6I72_07960 [Chloroflexi bacterium]|nr:MAG: hypothetical protein E6I72_07960 [Chloroflexota bacterium]
MKVALLASMLVAACSSGANTSAGHSPTPAGSPVAQASASPSAQASASVAPPPSPVTTPYGLLVGSQAASTYSVSLVSADGKVAATADSGTPPVVSCGSSAGAVVPLPVSTSNSRAYFMDGQGVVHFLAPNGDTGRATTVPAATASRRSIFAVSPDDQRIAVVVADFTSTGASTRLYVEDLNGGGNHLNLFSETGARSLWPVGWHGTNNLVLAVVPSCTQGGGPFCCGPLELHVVDPATATRRFTLGGQSCPIAGPPTLAGAVCEDTVNLGAKVLSWSAVTVRSFRIGEVEAAYISPDGTQVALVANSGTFIAQGAGGHSLGTIGNGMFACAWIDDQHVLSGGDAQHQPRIAEVTSGTMVPVAAVGDCGGRLPGGL